MNVFPSPQADLRGTQALGGRFSAPMNVKTIRPSRLFFLLFFPISQPRLKCCSISLEEQQQGLDMLGNELMKKKLRQISKTWEILRHRKGVLQFSADPSRAMPIWSHTGREMTAQVLSPYQLHFPPLSLGPPTSHHPETEGTTALPPLGGGSWQSFCDPEACSCSRDSPVGQNICRFSRTGTPATCSSSIWWRHPKRPACHQLLNLT